MRQRIFTTVLAIALGVNLYLGARHLASSAEVRGKEDVYTNMEKFTRVLETVRREYVDEEKVSYEELVHGALRGMIPTLDPHSEYMDAKKYQALQSDTSANRKIIKFCAPICGVASRFPGFSADIMVVASGGEPPGVDRQRHARDHL